MTLALPSPSEVIDNLDVIKEWLILSGLVLAVAIGVVTLWTMIWHAIGKRRERQEGDD